MPVISTLPNSSLKAVMYFEDHDPPHFHIFGNHHQSMALVDIGSLEITEENVKLNSQQRWQIKDWAQRHRRELSQTWEALKNTGKIYKIGGRGMRES